MKISKPIVLVGPMGVGKTTIGRKLASALGVPFVDTDALFVKQHGDITKFFADQGEAAFRKIEQQIVADQLNENAVIATGGGAVLSEATRDRLTKAVVVYLATDGTHMAKRLSQGNRPLLSNGIDDWKRIYDERKPIYAAICDLEVDCSGQPIKQSVADIVAGLGIND
jgi:shikimate kinase